MPRPVTHTGFGDRLAEAVARRESQVVLGLDPDPARLLPVAVDSAAAAGPATAAERAATAVRVHCLALIEAAAPACVGVKLQLACFERLGAPGWDALRSAVRERAQAGLLVLADGKRGDVPHTAAAYAQALLGRHGDAVGAGRGPGRRRGHRQPAARPRRPRADRARGPRVRPRECSCWCARRTPAPPSFRTTRRAGASRCATGWRRSCDDLGGEAVGPAGLSDVGAVVAATQPALIEDLRAAMPHAVFLLPGIGAQGGRATGRRAGVRADAARPRS